MKTIGVSSCLLGNNCKYSGGNNRSEAVLHYVEGCNVIPVCPECEGGLPCPRPPAEIVDGIVTNNLGVSVDAAFRKGAERCLQRLVDAGAELVILQPRSPSCGINRIYDGTFSGTLTTGDGVFAALLKQNGIPMLSAEDIPASTK